MEEIMIMVGTRPEAIKLCPVIRELKKRDRWRVTVCSSGQHRSMLDAALSCFDVLPDIDLDVMQRGQTLSSLASRILTRTEDILMQHKPSLVLVQGDTSTAFCSALAAFYRGIPIGHIEAGLRTHSIMSPFPEELHRTTLSFLSTYHFAPTVAAKKNLLQEGRKDSSIFITGNTVIDALRYTLTECRPRNPVQVPKDSRILLFTAHRRENLGSPISGMFRALRRLVDEYSDVIAVCPLHPNPEIRATAKECLSDHSRIQLIEPPDTVTFHHLLSRSYLVITDSGGIQEEAVALGIPTMVTRFSTERGEGLESGVLRLCGSDEEGIFYLGCRLLNPASDEYEPMKKRSKIYGDGNASRRIADILERIL